MAGSGRRNVTLSRIPWGSRPSAHLKGQRSNWLTLRVNRLGLGLKMLRRTIYAWAKGQVDRWPWCAFRPRSRPSRHFAVGVAAMSIALESRAMDDQPLDARSPNNSARNSVKARITSTMQLHCFCLWRSCVWWPGDGRAALLAAGQPPPLPDARSLSQLSHRPPISQFR